MLYADYQTKLSTLMVVPTSDANFIAILPACIDYAEQRLYRELDLASTSQRVTTFPLTSGNRNLTPTVGTFVEIDAINVITPVGAASPDAGTRNPLTRVSWDWLDTVYNSSANAGVPLYWAFQDAATLAVGPWPDAAYKTEIIGNVRPAPLSATNTSTTLSLYFPDLMIAASMIFMSGYMRDFGQQADDPTLALSWQTQYDKLIASAQVEEARKTLSGGSAK